MTAARIARRQERAAPAPHRSLIRFLLLHRIELTNRYPGLFLVGIGLLIVVQSVLETFL